MGESSLLPADLQHMGFKVGVYLPNREKTVWKAMKHYQQHCVYKV